MGYKQLVGTNIQKKDVANVGTFCLLGSLCLLISANQNRGISFYADIFILSEQDSE